MFAHEVAESFYILYRSFRKYAVSEIEDVTGAAAGLAQDVFRARLNMFPIRKQQNRIEISLHGSAKSQALPTSIERNTPVDANHLRAAFLHQGQEGSAIGAEINNRHAGLLQAFHQVGDVRQGIAAIVLHAQASDPAV